MCAIFGVFNAENAAAKAVIGLHANQHRGTYASGMVSSDGNFLFRERGPGIARHVFTEEVLKKLPGTSALAHSRYSTVTKNDLSRDNVQPIRGHYCGQEFALAHNGNLTNVDELKGSVPTATSMDTEYIVRLLEQNTTGDFETDLLRALNMVQGSYALGIIFSDRLIAVNDVSSNRPLCIGRKGASYFISSENSAFANVDAEYVEDVKAGTIVTIDKHGITRKSFGTPQLKYCVFESIYFSLPSSTVFGEFTAEYRLNIGRALEKAFPVPHADLVAPVPDSSTLIALGYGESKRSGAFFPAILRNHYTGRSFIAEDLAAQTKEVARKFIFSPAAIKGKVVVVVDDSIVRGTTQMNIVRKLRQLDAKEVHVRIGCPRIEHPCMYGIDTKNHDELIATKLDNEGIREKIGADSLEFLTLPMLKGVTAKSENYCFACMDGKYWHKRM